METKDELVKDLERRILEAKESARETTKGAGAPAPMMDKAINICGIICNCGPNGEPLACGYLPDHGGVHSWATIPTFPLPGEAVITTLKQELELAEYNARTQARHAEEATSENERLRAVLRAAEAFVETCETEFGRDDDGHKEIDWQQYGLMELDVLMEAIEATKGAIHGT